jgi:hypothetical protein
MCLGKAEHMRAGALLRSLMLIVVMMLFVAACSSDDSASGTTVADETPKEGPVTTATEVDFSSSPVAGTFEVTEGADVLGCSSGTFVDSDSGVRRVQTCDSGSNEGSFTVTFTFDDHFEGSSDAGTWSVVEGSDDFVGLQGGGDWSIVYEQTGPDAGVGTWTGDISYTS